MGTKYALGWLPEEWPLILFGSAFLAIWFLALAVFHAGGTGFNLMLLVPIASFLARSLQEARHRS